MNPDPLALPEKPTATRSTRPSALKSPAAHCFTSSTSFATAALAEPQA
jgi:hypothetical protein